MGGGGSISILVVGSHPLHAQGLSALLDSFEDLKVVGFTATFPDDLHHLVNCDPDLVLVDVTAPGTADLEELGKVRACLPGCRIVVMADPVEQHHVRAAIRLGVNGYLSSRLTLERLVESLRTIAGGEFVVCPQAVAAMEWQKDPLPLLLEQELKVLKAIADGLRSPQAAKLLCVSESTFRRNARAITRKLNAGNSVQAAVDAARRGLI